MADNWGPFRPPEPQVDSKSADAAVKPILAQLTLIETYSKARKTQIAQLYDEVEPSARDPLHVEAVARAFELSKQFFAEDRIQNSVAIYRGTVKGWREAFDHYKPGKSPALPGWPADLLAYLATIG